MFTVHVLCNDTYYLYCYISLKSKFTLFLDEKGNMESKMQLYSPKVFGLSKDKGWLLRNPVLR